VLTAVVRPPQPSGVEISRLPFGGNTPVFERASRLADFPAARIFEGKSGELVTPLSPSKALETAKASLSIRTLRKRHSKRVQT
jgi:hypothetical protein